MRPKTLIFVEEYLIDRNATRAAKAAGYSERTAYSQGSRLLKKVEVQAAIQEQLRQKTMTADEVLTRLTDIARFDVGDIEDGEGGVSLKLAKAKRKTHLLRKVKIRETIGDSGRRDSSIDVEAYSALDALELLGKYHGLFVDRSEVTVQGAKVLIWDIPSSPE